MESIHPNDIITMDLNTISYLTLKNGNMVLIDDSVPEKGNKDKMKLPKSTIFGKSEPKLSQKKFKLEITPHSTLFFKGIKTNSNKDNIRERYNYKIYNKIIKNESFYFKGIKLKIPIILIIYRKKKIFRLIIILIWIKLLKFLLIMLLIII